MVLAPVIVLHGGALKSKVFYPFRAFDFLACNGNHSHDSTGAENLVSGICEMLCCGDVSAIYALPSPLDYLYSTKAEVQSLD